MMFSRKLKAVPLGGANKEKMKGKTTHGAIGLWVDIGTIGYFKDLKVTK